MALATDPDEVMQLMLVVNARGRTTAEVGIPIGYYGNAMAAPAAISTAGELCTNPLSYAVELVRKAKKSGGHGVHAVNGRPHRAAQGAKSAHHRRHVLSG